MAKQSQAPAQNSPDDKNTEFRANEIAQAIRTAAANLLASAADVTEHANAVKTATKDDGTNYAPMNVGRLDVVTKIAALSLTNKWLDGEITKGCNIAKEQHNDARSAKTLATLTSDLKTFAHPAVRENVPGLIATVTKIWEAEQALIDEATKSEGELNRSEATPVHYWQARRYHAIAKLAKEMKPKGKKGVVNFSMGGNPESAVIGYAMAHNPDHDAARIAKRLEAIRETVAAMAKDFEHSLFNTIADALETVSEKEMLKARKAKMVREMKAAGNAKVVGAKDMTAEKREKLEAETAKRAAIAKAIEAMPDDDETDDEEDTDIGGVNANDLVNAKAALAA